MEKRRITIEAEEGYYKLLEATAEVSGLSVEELVDKIIALTVMKNVEVSMGLDGSKVH